MEVQFQYHQIILMIQSEFKDRYYGVVLKLIQNGKQARVQWIEDNTKSIEDIDIDNISSLRQKYLKNRKSLYYASNPRNQSDDVQFERQNLTPRDSSTPGKPKCFCYMLEIVAKFYFLYKENLTKLINFYVPGNLWFSDDFK